MIEILAVLLTLGCVLLASKRHILSWPIGIVAVVLYAVVFWDAKLYSDFGLQFIFLGQSIYGWYLWKQNKEKDSNQTKVEKMGKYERLAYLSVIILSSLVLGIIMNDYTDASAPFVDASVAITSLTANWSLAKRKLESWYLWVFVDTIYVGLFIYKELYFSAVLYGILFFIALQGLINWTTKYKNYGSKS